MKSATYLPILACVYLNFTPIFQVQIPLSVMSRDRAKGCLTMQERDSAHQAIREFSIALQKKTECGEGYWIRVAYLNMSDLMQSCPPSWRDRSANGVRVCGQPEGSGGQCHSTFYSTRSETYTRVCGQVIGYQFGHTDAFRSSHTIYQPYVDGVSITHGSPRSHIWTLAADVSERTRGCLCKGGKKPPPFVGTNYYCESGYNGTVHVPSVLFTGDPLWDGAGCENEGSCCSTAPWFTVDLVNSTTDDIEVRIQCSDYYEDDEDTSILLLELYIHTEKSGVLL